MAERIEMLQQELADYEKVKQFVLLSRPFDAARGELTATLKVCRKVVCEHYGIKYVQLQGIEKESGHPTVKGMETIANQVLTLIK